MAARFLSLGRFVSRRSPLHRLDAGAKLVSAALLAASSLWCTSLAVQAGLGAVLLLGFLLARLPFGMLLRALRGVAWLVVFVTLANLLWSQLAPVLGGASGEGAVRGAAQLFLLLARLANLVLLGVLVTSTTVPVDGAEGVERLLRPLGRLGLPVHELGLLLVLSLSFIPIFFAEARGLAAAHRIKTGSARWGLADRVRAAVPLVVPLFLSVLRRGDELAVALDARCFVPGRARSSLVPARRGGLEIGCLALSLGVLIASIWLV